ncbi:MAG: glycosyltransferase [Azoarcus sp.]|jgi:glycosyltransferase involved in cell wall biosynthesis|nr:glycosyltransferase [Azoarcus sp.]
MCEEPVNKPSIPQVLQFCHGYDGPFLDCARQYARLFHDTPYQVTTVYMTGAPNNEVIQGSASNEVIFLNYHSIEIRGLKWQAIRDIHRITATRQFSFCIAHRFKPIYVALLATRLPVIGVHHAFNDYQRLSRRIFARIFRHRLALLGVSNAVHDNIRASLPSWPHDRIETLYNRIDTDIVQSEQLTHETARAALKLPQDAWVVGNVGRLHPDKDQTTLIRAFACALPQLPPGSLLAIMGNGKMEAPLKALALELNVAESIQFLGHVPNARCYFKAFDVFVLSSDHEPFGMVLLEAMAASIPLICSDCGGGREVVAGIGDLFPFKNVDALAQCLINAASRKMPDSYPARAVQHLRQHFSDQAAYEAFWKFEFVRKLVENKTIL